MDAVEVILFDLDNTLLDRTRTFGRFVEHLLHTYLDESEITPAIYERIIHLDEDGYKDKRELFHQLLAELPWRKGGPPEHAELMAFYQREYVNQAVLFEQALDVVTAIRSKFRTGLITNGQTAIQHGKVDRLGLRPYFDAVIVSEEAGVKKPDPAIFAMAAEQLQVKAEQCLYVGDHPVNDIAGASRAGMRTIWIEVNQPWRADLDAEPLHRIKRLQELPSLLL